MPTLGQAIAADRARLGLSQQELAQRIGVSQQAVAKWEAGAATPRGKRLQQLAGAFGKSSQTNVAVAGKFHTPATPEVPMTPEQMQAIQTLAQAAQQLAQAAQSIADSVARITQPPPTRKH